MTTEDAIKRLREIHSALDQALGNAALLCVAAQALRSHSAREQQAVEAERADYEATHRDWETAMRHNTELAAALAVEADACAAIAKHQASLWAGIPENYARGALDSARAIEAAIRARTGGGHD